MPRYAPLNRKGPRRVIAVGISLPADMIPYVDQLAQAEGRSRSNLISYLLLDALRQKFAQREKTLDEIITKNQETFKK